VRVHDFDRDPAIETTIARAIHGGHSAVADLVADFVAFDAGQHDWSGRLKLAEWNVPLALHEMGTLVHRPSCGRSDVWIRFHHLRRCCTWRIGPV
jgi:hypothetical protein